MGTLYHASTAKDLDVLEPQRTVSHDKYIGDYIFATHNRAYAAMYLALTGRAMLLSVFDDKPYFVVNDTAEQFMKADKGGAIYEVPAETFVKTPQVELDETERVSLVAVKPVDQTVYDTSLQALKQFNVPIYFVDDDTFQRIQHAKDHGWKILIHLKPYYPAS